MRLRLLNEIHGPEDLRRLRIDQLPTVAAELRQMILETISKNGGHLGAAMGAVELAIGLHYVFESPRDRIIWDVGHQAHAHKILTGRRDQFQTIKQDGGLSGFLKRSESPHDIFGAGHASTSISAALGIREALRLKDGKGKVVALIGDGGLTGGMAFEALNAAGALKHDLIVVLNDNGMSISPNVGALSKWFSRKLTGSSMTRWRRRVKTLLSSFDKPGQDAIGFVERIFDATKTVLLSPGVMFEGMGFEYIGPIDGHDLPSVIETLNNARRLDRPTVVHAKTRKGEGVPGVEEDQERFHGVGPFDLHSGKPLPAEPHPPSYTNVFGSTLCEVAAADPRVVAITAAMPQGTGLAEFAERFPGRFYDVGIAEQHAVTFAAGMACEGYRPVCAIYSSFLQRAYDQVLHDVCLQNLPVVLCMDRSGLVGPDGPTHHGLFDIAFLRMMPNMTLLAPRDEGELRHALMTALRADGPVGIRYPRGAGVGANLEAPKTLPWGKAEVMLEGETNGLLVLAVGPHVHSALSAAALLQDKGISPTVINARFLKPLDEALLADRISRSKTVLTIEEGCLTGGFGTAVMELCEQHGLQIPVHRLGVPDRFIRHGRVDGLRDECGLTPERIAAACTTLARSSGKVLSLA